MNKDFKIIKNRFNEKAAYNNFNSKNKLNNIVGGKIMRVNYNTRPLEVACDIGNGFAKISYSIDEGRTITSMYIESNVTVNADDSSSNVTVINGINHDFNTTDRVIDKVVRIKNTDEHRGLLWKSLSEVFKKTNHNRFKVVFGCSVDSWNRDKGEYEKAKMTEFTNINYVENDKSYDLEIVDLKVQPECVLAPYSFSVSTLEMLKETNFILFDIGNLNLGYCRYLKNLRRDSNFNATTDGVDEMLQNCCDYINKNDLTLRHPLTKDGLRAYLMNEDRYEDNRFKNREKLIQEYINSYIDSVMSNAMRYYKDLTSDYKVVVIGGGAKAFERFLQKAINKVSDMDGFNFEYLPIDEDLIFCNSKAFYKRSKKLFS